MKIKLAKKLKCVILLNALIILVLSAGCNANNTNIANSNITKEAETDSITPKIKNTIKDQTDTIQTLKSEGYDTKDIESSELYVKRISLQLNEISTFNDSFGIQQKIGIEHENVNYSQNYSKLLEKLDDKIAVYYVVKLKQEFSDIEKALDEYLISIQLNLDLSGYFKDKNQYNKIKEEKLSEIVSTDLIDVKSIERKSLENLQKLNDFNKNSLPGVNPRVNNPSDSLVPNINNPQPGLPKVDIPRPVDPSEELNKKISPGF